MSDPLPQAMVLTAIVITFGMVSFVLAMAYRSWQLNGHDEVQDDVEDRRIVRLAERDEVSASYDDDTRDDGTPDQAPPDDGSDPDAPPAPSDKGTQADNAEAVGR